jgi:DNA-binding response OmpR family regulator
VPDILVATDAVWVHDEVEAALGGPDATIRWVRHGMDVLPSVEESPPDLAVLDLQIGNMGGMATCMALHLESSSGRIARVPVLMLLDRPADVFLARRCDAEGWMIKPVDSFRLRKAANALLAGGTHHEGLPKDAPAPLPT